jgi:L-alanine-DL-glutamate epimerase and related enzymes of enolase superfamily
MENSATTFEPVTPCRIKRLVAMHVRIPLKRRVKHASFSRTENDTIIVRCELDNGVIGFGEGIPRNYVTGETVEDALQILRQTRTNNLLESSWSSISEAVGALSDLQLNTSGLTQPESVQGRHCFGNAARCAIEVALLDAVFQHFQQPLWKLIEFLPSLSSLIEIKDRVQYSTVITTSRLWKAVFTAAAFRYYKFAFGKVKLTTNSFRDKLLLSCLKTVLGKSMDLRVDANEAWTLDQLNQRFKTLKRFKISAVEQPVAHRDVASLTGVSKRLGLPIVLDESLCSRDDAERCIGEQLCDIFNLRISKCGGIIPCLQLAKLAHEAGLGYQLGCQVGETGILTAAGRHLACSLKGIKYLEGSYDRLLVAERLTTEDLTFKRGGWGRRIDGFGLGIQIDPEALKRVMIDEFELSPKTKAGH